MTAKQKLAVKEMDVKALPGIPGGLHLKEINLSDRLNIITGPNGSGKSSLARAMGHALWIKGERGCRAHFGAHDGTNDWVFTIDGSAARATKGNEAEQRPPEPMEKGWERYALALDQLIKGEDKNLGKTIRTELNGGYDVEAAAAGLGYSAPKVNVNKDYRAYTARVDELRAIRDKQAALFDRLKDLEAKENEKNRIDQELKNLKLYRTQLDLLENREKISECQARLEQFPENMSKLREDDYERYRELEQKLKATERVRENLTTELDKLKAEIAELNLPDSLNATEELEVLREFDRRIKDAEKERLQSKTDLDAAEGAVQEAANQLGLQEDRDPFKQMPEGWPGRYQQLLSDFLTTKQKRVRTEEDLKALREKLDSEESLGLEAEKLRAAHSHLANWVEAVGEGTPSSGSNASGKTLLWLAVAVAAVSAVLGFTLGPVWAAIASAVAVVLILAAAFSGNKAASPDMQNRSNWERKYRDTGAKAPDKWDAEAVAARMSDLAKDLASWELRSDDEKRCERLQKELEAADKELATAYTTFAEAIQSIGFETGGDEPEMAALFDLLQRAEKWREAVSNHAGLRAQLSSKEKTLKQALQQFNERVEVLNAEAVESVEQYIPAHEALVSRLKKYEESTKKYADKEKELQRLTSEKEGHSNDIEQILVRVGLTTERAEELPKMHDQLSDYNELLRDIKGYEWKVQNANDQLGQADAATVDRIRAMEADELREGVERESEQTERKEQLIKDIADINAEVGQAKDGVALQQALQAKEAALDEVQIRFESHLSSAAGYRIKEAIMAEAQAEGNSKVYAAAKDLFTKITKGKWELLIPADSGAFMARNTETRADLTLDQLSTGTRIQLLLSVRLAYIESIEREHRMPLMVDELLANSDDERAEAIIDALLEIVETGRQVFYFTAQEDEVVKWRRKLMQQQVNHTVVRLDEHGGETISIEELPEVAQREPVPSPEGYDRLTYGKMIKVPQVNPLTDEVMAVHLWYLIPDLAVLHRLLEAGLDTWGQLAQLSATPVAGFDAETWQTLASDTRKRAEWLRAMLEVYRQGRPQPITRDDLEASEAVSGSFIDAVSEKLVELKHNPQALIEALKGGEVPRFRSSSTEELEQYLTDQNKLGDPRRIVTLQELQESAQLEALRHEVPKDEAEQLFGIVFGEA